MEVNTGDDSASTINAGHFSLSADGSTSDSASVKWEVPTEDTTEAAKLKYSVYYSKSGPFETVAEVEAGERFGAANQKELTSETITGLSAGTSYYVNVVVTDGNGNKTAFKPTLVLTDN